MEFPESFDAAPRIALRDPAAGRLAGVADRGGAADELRVRAVHGADAQQAAEDIGNVRAERAAVGVHLIHHDVFQAAQEIAPAPVWWKSKHPARGGFLLQFVGKFENRPGIRPQIPRHRKDFSAMTVQLKITVHTWHTYPGKFQRSVLEAQTAPEALHDCHRKAPRQVSPSFPLQ